MKTAKFRGVPFEIETVEDEPGGARNIIHEFPGRADAQGESAGNFPRRFTLTGHLIGRGYEVRLTDLELALAEPGDGVLEHPTRGKLTVRVDGPYRVFQSSTALGKASVTISFVEIGLKKSPALTVDTGLSLAASSQSMLDGLRVGRLDMSGFDFIRRDGAALLAGPQSVTTALRRINTRISSALGLVDDLSHEIDDFTAELDHLLDTPDTLAITLQGLMNSVLALVSEAVPFTTAGDRQAPSSRVGLALQNLSQLGTLGNLQAPIEGETPSRVQQRTNHEEINDLVEASALAETCALFVDIELGSFAEANQVFEATAAIFDRLLERGTLEDDAAQRLRKLRADFFAHLRRRAADLSDLTTVTPKATLPAILLAWNLYGDATRADEIVTRNDVEHPGFLQGGVDLAVAGV